jgi:predicted TPR repeat methyltransferase
MSNTKLSENKLLQRAYDIKNQTECKEVYQDWAQTYDETMVDDLSYTAPKTVADVLANFLPNKRSTILDLGCGTGLVGEGLKDLGYETIDGVDFSGEMLKVAEKRGVYRQLLLEDLTKTTSIPSGAYDAAICAGLFTCGHLDASCLEEVFRTIKPNGLFAGAIRQQIWEEMGFLEKFTKWEGEQKIKIVSKQHMDNYENANKKDGVYLVVRKLS